MKHHRAKTLVPLFVFFLAIMPRCGSAAELTGPITFTVAGQQPGLVGYGYATTIAKFMQDVLPADSTVNVIPRGGALTNATVLDQGKADVGITVDCAVQFAWDGYDKVYGRYGKHEKLRYVTIGAMTASASMMVARRDWVEKTGIDTFEKFVNAKKMPRLVLKPPGSVVPLMFEEMLKFHGKSYDAYRDAGKLMQIQASQVGELLRDGRADVYFENVPGNHPAFTETALTNDLVYLPFSDAENDYMKQFGMTPYVIKAGSYSGLDKDYTTMSTSNIIVASADSPEEAIYLLTKSLIERREEFIEDNPQAREWDPANDHDRSAIVVPLHPGAERYYREIGWVK